MPDRHLEAGVGEAAGELADRRDLEADEVEAGLDESLGFGGGVVGRRLRQRRPDPRPRGVAEEGPELAPDRAVGVDAIQGRVGELAR
jgi:hypothetical protein